MAIQFGTAKAAAGKLVYGEYDLVDHPVGGRDRLPVVIAQGSAKGPVFCLSAGIHGNEHAGLQVLHLLITKELVKKLKGTVICLPALNPAALRLVQRQAYYHSGDPNRLFPDHHTPEPDIDIDPPSCLETAYTQLFERIRDTSNYWIDLHNAWTGSMSFVYRDRIYYHASGTASAVQAAKKQAEKLHLDITAMCEAYGHSVIMELPPRAYFEEKLHRSTTGAAVNIARIPAVTLELGTGHMPDPHHVHAAVTGLRNVLKWAGMLEGEYEPITGIKVVSPSYPVRRRGTPRLSCSGIVRHLVEPGDTVKPGDPIAEIRDIWGRPIAEKVFHSEYEGYILGRCHGIVHYPGTELFGMAIKDDLPAVMPYPA